MNRVNDVLEMAGDYAEVKRLGADAVEVSRAQVSMSLDDKCNLIKMARDAGLEVVGEAGQKAKDGKSQSWYISTLGNGVNLDIDDDQIIDVELMRRNIRKRNMFGLIGSTGT